MDINPFAELLRFFATHLGGSYGWSIVVVTIIIRLLLLPLFRKQEKQQVEMNQKMRKMQPEMLKLREKFKKAKDITQQRKIQQEMRELQQKHGVSVMSMGFLPALIQLPILTALYYAIAHSDILANHSFLWFTLTEKDMLLVAIMGVLYLIQFKLAEKTTKLSSPDTPQMSFILYIFPIMMVFIGSKLASGVVLYWTVGAIFMIGYKSIQYISRKKNLEAENTKNK